MSNVNRLRYESDQLAGRLTELKAFTSAHAFDLGVLDLAILVHALTGDFQQALWHSEYIETHQIELSPSEQATVWFALGVGFTRISEYKKARSVFAQLGIHRHGPLRARFFLQQGLGFFHFFLGRFEASVKYAANARKMALQDEFMFGQMLAEELYGLSCIEAGQIRFGLECLKGALKLARKAGNQTWMASFELHILLNETQHGIGAHAISRLQKALLEFHPEESHSRNSVKLELANQFILRGRADDAKKILDEACESIYSSRNRRQIALLNFRLSFLIFLRGSADDALHLLRSAEMHLHEGVDRVLLQKMRSLRARIQGKSKIEDWHVQSEYGDDPLGDLFRKVARKKDEGLREALREGLYYLLLEYFDLSPQDQILAFDLIPKGIVRIDRGNVAVISKGFSHTLRKMIEALAEGHMSKDELVRRVWGYPYSPERHDPLIYTTISKIRAWLGECADWIESDNKGYRLRPQVRVLDQELKMIDGPVRLPKLHKPYLLDRDLNIRWMKILALSHNQALHAGRVMKEFGVSRATATRDLNELVKRGLLRKIGRARATYYVEGDS